MQLAAIQLPDIIIDGPVDENGLSFSYDQDQDETNISKASWNNLYFDNARRSFEQILRIQQMRYILLLRYLQEIIFEYNRFNQI